MVISEFVPKSTLRLISAAKRALKNIHKGEDSEALHDTRVAVRRLRSVLREIRSVYDIYYINLVRNALKEFFEITGALRDLEVGIEELSKLKVSEANLERLNAYVNSLKAEEEVLRKSVIGKISETWIDEPAKTLQSLLNLPLKPSKDGPVEIFAFKKANKLRKNAKKMAGFIKSKVGDIELLHDFRIIFKRLRYTIEYFNSVLPGTYPLIARHAKKMQSLLGDIHDYDVLIQRVEKEDASLTQELAEELKAILKQKRETTQKDILNALEGLSEKL
jgi:CHAD domain-containing protein